MNSPSSLRAKGNHLSQKPAKGRSINKSALQVELLEERALLATGLGPVPGLTDSPNALLTTGFYHDLLHRAPITSEVAGWTVALQAGMSPQQEAIGFLTSPEYYSDLVNSDYRNLLQRGPSSTEVNAWASDLQAGVSQQQVEVSFLTSSEYYQLQGSNANQWLASLYQKVLNRPATAGELTAWNQDLLSGSSLSAIATEIVTSAEANALQVNSAYQQLLSRGAQPPEVAGWVGAMQNGLSTSGLIAEIASSPEFLADQTLTSPVASLTVSPGALPAATESNPFSAAVSASGGSGSYTYAVTGGSLPAGLSLNTSTGMLSGTPTDAGPTSFAITASDNNSNRMTGTAVYNLIVNPLGSLTVSPGVLPAATVDGSFSATLNASGGSGASTFAVTSGSLPAGLSLNAASGVISGTPLTSGSDSFTITATDKLISGLTGSQAYTLVVNPLATLTVSPGTLPGATVNTAFSGTLSASGGSGSYTYAVTAGSLPAGLSLNTSTGMLSGTPTNAGPTSFAITASDNNSAGLTGTTVYNLIVNPLGSLTVSPGVLPAATVDGSFGGYTQREWRLRSLHLRRHLRQPSGRGYPSMPQVA